MKWKKIKIITEQGEQVNAQAPVIISASRSTDIPAFYSDWFIERFKKGYLKWKNPFNGISLYVSFEKVRLAVFWSKNPKPMFRHLDFLDENLKNYYFQFTLNDYDKEKFENRVPNVKSRIETFIKLSKRIGKEKVVWRFDPFILTDTIGVDELLKRVENIGDQLKQYTNKLVFSFADIKIYKKVQSNLRREAIKYLEFDERTMNEMAQGIKELNTKWNFEIGTCAEKIDLAQYGIFHNKCIDDDLIIKLFRKDKVLMDFICFKEPEQNLFAETISYNRPYLKDKGQRKDCGCIISKDIGQYNTCPHMCVYCYANTSSKIVDNNYILHKQNPSKESIF